MESNEIFEYEGNFYSLEEITDLVADGDIPESILEDILEQKGLDAETRLKIQDKLQLGNPDDLDEILSQYPPALRMLIEGYIEYCYDVISGRAIPKIDGLKPVQRRILWTMHSKNYYASRGKTKSHSVAGDVMKIHPHSSVPIYEAAVKMVDSRGTYRFPLINGKGYFGKSYSNKPASADRYTEIGLSESARVYFGELNGIEMVDTEDNSALEPVTLPCSFPTILANPTQGVAVGIASRIPSFNILDILDLTREYITTGECNTIIAPDFESGGSYIINNDELYDIMTEGRGSLKLRANYTITGKIINFTEIPYGATGEKIKERILELNLSDIKDVSYLADRRGLSLEVECSTQAKVMPVLYTLLKDTDLQTNFSANMYVIIDNKPRLLGVWDLIKEWTKYRREVLTKEITSKIEPLRNKQDRPRALVKYLSLPITEIDKVLEIAKGNGRQGKKMVKDYIKTIFPEESSKMIEAMASLPIYELGSKDIYQEEVESIEVEINRLTESLAMENINKEIINQLNRLSTIYSSFTRKTKLTDVDYNFVSESDTNGVVIDDQMVTVVYSEGFVKKTNMNILDDNLYTIRCKANDTLIGVDTFGRILRVYLSQIPYTTAYDIGTYVQQYCGVEGGELVSLEVLEEKEKMVIYSDGKLGFINYSEWIENNRQVKVLEDGISTKEANKLCEIIDTPEVLLVQTRKNKIGIVYPVNVNRKSRKARTAVFNVDKNDEIIAFSPLTYSEEMQYIQNRDLYTAPIILPLQNSGDLSADIIFEAGINYDK